MLPRSSITPLLPALGSMSRPRSGRMVHAMHAMYYTDPLAKKLKKAHIAWSRFNVKKGARVLYLGDDYLTCAAETRVSSVPTWIVAFAPVLYDLQAVLDLTDAAVQGALHTFPAEIAANFRSVPLASRPTPTQWLGEELAASAQIDAIYFDSAARPGHHCLAVFVDTLEPLGGKLEVFDPKAGVTASLP